MVMVFRIYFFNHSYMQATAGIPTWCEQLATFCSEQLDGTSCRFAPSGFFAIFLVPAVQ
jgi:hypothetical protein